MPTAWAGTNSAIPRSMNVMVSQKKTPESAIEERSEAMSTVGRGEGSARGFGERKAGTAEGDQDDELIKVKMNHL